MIMRRIRYMVWVCIVLLAGESGLAQDRYDSGRLKGFTKYSAFEVVELETPFTVRRIEGFVLPPNSKDALPDVLVEIRDSEGRIRSTRTNARGHFSLGRLHQGNYDFKTTLSGFSSVVGTFMVRTGIKKSDTVRIEMPFGV